MSKIFCVLLLHLVLSSGLEEPAHIEVISNGNLGLRQHQECNMQRTKTLQTVIETPSNFSGGQFICDYQIGPAYVCPNEFHVQFLNFSLPLSENCSGSRIEVGAGAFCGNVSGFRKFQTPRGQLDVRVRLLNDGGASYKLIVTQLPCRDEVKCDRTEISARQDIPVIPLPPFEPPPTIPPPILPPNSLPQCCRNGFRLPRFIFVSDGFPSYTTRNSDCVYQIQRPSPAFCRVRILFKHFAVDQDQFGCGASFIEVDGQRICGCKSGFVYESQWGVGQTAKFIRYRSVAGRHREAQGFVFDVIQEPCPYRLELAESFGSNKEQVHAKFFNQRQAPPGFCVFNLFTLLQIKMETLLVPKEVCLPHFYL